MNIPTYNNSGFPWFEENKISGWLVQVKAHLHHTDFHVILERSGPDGVDNDGKSLVYKRVNMDLITITWYFHIFNDLF